MKIFLSAVMTIIIMLACNNEGSNKAQEITGNNISSKNENETTDGDAGNCGNNLLFKKGAEIQTSSYNDKDKVTGKSVSTLKKIDNKGAMSIAEWETKHTDEDGGNEKTMTVIYKCDGKQLYVDMTSFMPDSKQSTDIETTGLQFPFNVSVGEVLPDFTYSTNISMGGKSRKITSHIKERKVEAKEIVTTTAGSFECYKISSVVEAETDMPEMDEESKKIMEQVKKKMGKNVMTFWYAPDVTIIKMEFRMGEKLAFRSEVTGIKK